MASAITGGSSETESADLNLLGSRPSLSHTRFSKPAVEVARDLLGMLILRELDGILVVARIVETEAYAADIDEASHSYRGQTPRNAVMFGPAGHAYVYRSYGIHHMFNVVTTMPSGAASAVLIRGAEVLQGHQALQARRPNAAVGALLRGPGNLAAALELGPALNGHLLSLPPLRLAEGWPAPESVVITTRIGITRSVELPWRFYLLGSPGVSRRDRAAEARLHGPSSMT